jgi:uncharacterized protein
MSLFDDDIDWVRPGDGTISGTYRGKAELGEYLGKWVEKSTTVKVDRLLADGDIAVALTEVVVGGETAYDADEFLLPVVGSGLAGEEVFGNGGAGDLLTHQP